MRVVLLGDYPPDPGVIVGGPQAVLSYLVRSFEAHPDADVHVVTFTKGRKQDRVIRHGIATIHYLAEPRLPVELRFRWSRRRVREVLDQIHPDLVHAQNNRLYSWLAMESHFPTVVTAHAIHGEEHQYRHQLLARVRHAVRDALLRRYFERHVQHLVCISPYIENGYRGRITAQMHAIENPIDDRFFELDPKRGVPGRVLFAGLIVRRKNPALLLDAAARVAPRVPYLSVHLAGGSPDSRLSRQLQQTADFSGLDGRIAFLGHLNEEQVLQEYQDTEVLALTSAQETSPMVIQQAMAAGKPVVATAVGGVPHLVHHGETGFLVEPGDAGALAHHLELLVTDRDRARAMGQRAREEAHRRFRSDVVAAKTVAMYRDILAQREPVPAMPAGMPNLQEP